MPRSSADRDRNGRSVSRSRSKSPEERRSRKKRSYSRSRSASPNTSKRLHIANIDESVRKRDIEDSFGKFGKLEDVWLASYPPLYAFVVYQDANDAAAALKEMRSGYIRDCHIRTSVALPRNSGKRGPPRRNFRSSRSPRDSRRTFGRDDRRRDYSPRDRRRDRSPPRRDRRRSRS